MSLQVRIAVYALFICLLPRMILFVQRVSFIVSPNTTALSASVQTHRDNFLSQRTHVASRDLPPPPFFVVTFVCVRNLRQSGKPTTLPRSFVHVRRNQSRNIETIVLKRVVMKSRSPED